MVGTGGSPERPCPAPEVSDGVFKRLCSWFVRSSQIDRGSRAATTEHVAKTKAQERIIGCGSPTKGCGFLSSSSGGANASGRRSVIPYLI